MLIGCLIVAGKVQLALAPFEANRTFLGGDVARFLSTQKARVAGLLQLLLANYLQGHFQPVTPITTFKAENIADAFKHMQKGLHMGKIVIQLPREDTLPLAPTVPPPEFRDDAVYVLVGGLGGLGKAIASWMVSHGARHLMFLSRSAGKSLEDQDFFKELGTIGCSTQFFPVDISDAAALKDAIFQANLPIAGAMHMAMVLADRSIYDMDLKTWNKAVLPKVQGAWNLHNLLPEDMDFLILFSSIGGTHGYYGQSNYSSGNTFLDAFSQFRQNLGRRTSVISIGPIDDVGLVSRTESIRDALRQNLASLLTESHFLDTLQLAVARASAKSATEPQSNSSRFSGYYAPNHIFHATEPSTPIMDPGNLTMWKRDPRMAIFRNIQKVSTVESTGSTSQLKQFLLGVAKEPSKLEQKTSTELIAKELSNCISNFMMSGDGEIDASLSLSAAGVDSLVAIEIRNWWRQNLGTDISVLELLGGGSIEQLGGLAVQRLKTKYLGKQPS